MIKTFKNISYIWLCIFSLGLFTVEIIGFWSVSLVEQILYHTYIYIHMYQSYVALPYLYMTSEDSLC